MVDVVPTTNPATADLTINADTNPTRTDLANTIRTTLGLPPTTNPTLTPADIHQLGSDISRADLARAITPSWADQHTTPTLDTNPTVDTTPTVDLDAIHNQYAEQTPAGVSHHRGDPTMGDLPHRVPADPHRFTADTHITPDGRARIGDHTLTPEQYGDLLRRSGWDGTTPIRLIGCDASTNGFANRLAQHLGVEVLAPTQAAWTDTNGNVFSSSAITNPNGTRTPRIPPDGQWQTHRPDGSTVPQGPIPHPQEAVPGQLAESAVSRGDFDAAGRDTAGESNSTQPHVAQEQSAHDAAPESSALEPSFSMVEPTAAEIADLVEMQRSARRGANVGWRTMGGAAEFSIGGHSGSFAGFSGTRDVTQNAATGTALPPVAPPAEHNSIVPDIPENELRQNDAENNLLEHIYSQIRDSHPIGENGSNDIEGRVRLFSEQEPCESCNPTIRAFQQMYPNVIIEVYYVLPYPPVRRDRPTL